MMRVPVLLAVVVAACLATLNVNAASEELSYDGLQRRETKVFEHLWVRKYFDVRSYHKIIFKAPHIEYRPVMKGSGDTSSGFALNQRQKDSLAEIVDKAFQTELAKSKFFKLTTEPGPDVSDHSRRPARRRVVRAAERQRPQRSVGGGRHRRSDAQHGTVRLRIGLDHGARARTRRCEARRERTADDRGRCGTAYRDTMGKHPARAPRRRGEHSDQPMSHRRRQRRRRLEQIQNSTRVLMVPSTARSFSSASWLCSASTSITT